MQINSVTLAAHNLSVKRGDVLLFTDLNFTLEPGQWLHVRGANGVGKTSLLRLLSGLTPPETGRVTWQGQSIHGEGSEIYRHAMLYSGHQAALKEDLSARENLVCITALAGTVADASQINLALTRFDLTHRADLAVRYLSAGQKRRVGMARLAVASARLWILDEPFNALDNDACTMLTDLINAHLGTGGMAILTSHQDIQLAASKTLLL